MSNENIDRIILSYSDSKETDVDDVSLPYRLLVLGNFSGSDKNEIEDNLRARTVTRHNINVVLKQLNIVLDHSLSLGNYYVDVSIPIQSLSDFNPQTLANKIEPLKLILKLCDDLEEGRPHNGKSPEWLTKLKIDCGIEKGNDISPLISACMLQAVFSFALNSLIHDERFKQLETVWRDLDRLLQSQEGTNSSIDILDITFDQLINDLGKNNEFVDSQLYDLLYNVEYGQYGGIPYSTAVLGFTFGLKRYKLNLLVQLAKLGERCHLPFLSQAEPDFFQIQTFSELADISDVNELFKGPSYIYWRTFQEKSYAQYIALTLPGILRRSHYKTSDFNDFKFDEEIDKEGNHLIWGNAAFDYAACLVKSFNEYGSGIAAVGEDGGLVDPFENIDTSGQKHALLPVMLSERRESELSELGFMPLTLESSGQSAVFHRVHSIAWGAIKHKIGDDVLDMRLGAQIPYLLLVTRIAHYMKVIQRDRLGSLTSASEIAAELNHWLQGFVSDIDNPVSSVRARRPFRHADVTINTDSEQMNFSMNLRLVPHMQYMGANFSLSLEGGL